MRTATRTFALLVAVSLLVASGSGDDIVELRAGGQAAVDELHAQVLQASPPARAALEARLDRVCAQKDCAASRLFWFTDLEEAKHAAHRLGRPILALHLLGRLDEELSCANSRFFRTLLYSDDSISDVLRDGYVLYWHSERPVPRVTIEMGDGRVIRQTITGNSAHYLLDENGEPLDVLPGLYSPKAFREALVEWLELHESLYRADAKTRRELVIGHHARLLSVEGEAPIRLAIERPTAINASKLAVVKSVSERPLLAQLQKPTSLPIADLQPLAEWMAVGERGKDAVALSGSAIQLIAKKQFGSATVDEDAMSALLDGVRRNVAADTAFNERMMRPRIHERFANGEVADLASLNAWVYRDLFLTPSDDPWLGLQPASVFTAIGE
jgi:hypothetical protein